MPDPGSCLSGAESPRGALPRASATPRRRRPGPDVDPRTRSGPEGKAALSGLRQAVWIALAESADVGLEPWQLSRRGVHAPSHAEPRCGSASTTYRSTTPASGGCSRRRRYRCSGPAWRWWRWSSPCRRSLDAAVLAPAPAVAHDPQVGAARRRRGRRPALAALGARGRRLGARRDAGADGVAVDHRERSSGIWRRCSPRTARPRRSGAGAQQPDRRRRRAERLQAANSLRAFAESVAQIAGPALAGVLVVAVGRAPGLAVDAASFVASALVLATVAVTAPVPAGVCVAC